MLQPDTRNLEMTCKIFLEGQVLNINIEYSVKPEKLYEILTHKISVLLTETCRLWVRGFMITSSFLHLDYFLVPV